VTGLIVPTGLFFPAAFMLQFQIRTEKPSELVLMSFCGLLEGEPTTRLELVTYRLRIDATRLRMFVKLFILNAFNFRWRRVVSDNS